MIFCLMLAVVSENLLFASGVGMHLTRKVHPTFSWEYWGNYTGVVEDMMDNDGLTSHSSVRYSENVSGFILGR